MGFCRGEDEAESLKMPTCVFHILSLRPVDLS